MRTLLCLSVTLLKTNISSSHTGSSEFPLDVLVLYFLFVSAGSPKMSTSTYTPTFLSVRNWPEITWLGYKFVIFSLTGATKLQILNSDVSYFNFDRVSDYAVYYVFCERVKVFVCPSHELWLQQVTAQAIILKHTHVQLHRKV